MTFDINKFLAEEKARLEETLGYIADGKVYAPEDVTIVKSSAVIPVSLELLMDSGAITEEEARARGWEPTVYPPIPRRVRLRWWINARRIRFGRWLGSWIAGERLYTDDEAADYE